MTQMVITDLTRMYGGHVCVAGYDKNGDCVRLSTPRVREADIVRPGLPLIFPSAQIECDLLEHQPDPPHTEDYKYQATSIRLIQRIDSNSWQDVLERSRFNSVAAIFEQPILRGPGQYILQGQGPRSIGTIRPKNVHEVVYESGSEGAWDYRLAFYDRQDKYYRLKITDFTWHRYCAQQRAAERTPEIMAQQLTMMLKSRQVYIRIGLSRGWSRFPERCYLQINGVYTFPDYLDGRTFVDLMDRSP